MLRKLKQELREKKAQIHFGETMMIVVVLMLLIIIVVVFVSRASYNGTVKEIKFSRDLQAIKLAKYATSLPELSCGGIIESSYCVDKLKIDALAGLLNGPNADSDANEYYQKIFGYAKIEFINGTIDSEKHAFKTVVLYNYSPQISGSQKLRTTTSYYFITVHDPLIGGEKFNTMKITRYFVS